MSDERDNSVEWNGKTLIGWIEKNGIRTKLSVDRDMIHRYVPGFNDAVGWEIERYRVEIFAKLIPHLGALDKA